MRQKSKRFTVNNEHDAIFLANALRMKREFDLEAAAGLSEEENNRRRRTYERCMRRIQHVIDLWAEEKIEKYQASAK